MPDSELVNTSAATNIEREIRKLYIYNNAPNKQFIKTYKLSDLFGFCSDWKKPLYKIRLKITLTRQFNDDIHKFLYHSAPNVTGTGTVAAPQFKNKVGIAWLEEINLKVPLNELNSKPQIMYESQFNGNKEVDIVFNAIIIILEKLQETETKQF